MQQLENNDIIDLRNVSTQYGLLAGLVMAVLLIAFQLSGQDYSPFLKLSKYGILAVSIVVALNIYRSESSKDIFIEGIQLGTKLSAIAAAALVLVNVLLYSFAPEYAFSKYNMEPTSMLQAAIVSGVLFFETIVFGSIITFAAVQFLKGENVQ